jgi:hypothetical protein
MATEILRPNGAGSETNIPGAYPGTGEAHWEDVDEEVADDGTTWVENNTTTYQRDLYALPAHSGSGTINKITVYCKARCNSSSGTDNAFMRISCRSDSTTTDGDEKTLIGSADPWHYETQEWAVNPADSQPWEWADIDALEIGASIKKGTKSLKLTQVYVEVDYTAVTPKTSSDTGSGVEGVPVPRASLAGGETGAGIEALLARLLAAFDTGTGAEVAQVGGLLKGLFAAEGGRGIDALVVKREIFAGGEGVKFFGGGDTPPHRAS